MPTIEGAEPPLAGIRVIDLSATLPGPYCTQLLADLGAEIIKVERPNGGDSLRLLMPAVFRQFNRGKRSLTLDLKDPVDQSRLWRLLADADVLVEGFRPGVMARLGLDADEVRDQLPQLVYCSISGWGQDGPLSDAPAHDINYLGAVGALTDPMTGEADAPPSLLVADLAAGTTAAVAILAALMARGRTGVGATLDLGMADVVMTWAMATHIAGVTEGAGAAEVSPAHGVFRAADGRLVTLGAIEDHFWERFRKIAGDERLAAPRFDSHEGRRTAYTELRALLEEVLAARTAAQWVELARAADVPLHPVASFAEALEHEHFRHRAIIRTGEHRRGAGALPAGFPVRWSGGILTAGTEVPELGESEPGDV